eukprot:1158765-Pelagomonas_calceolata.AAC.7
MVSTDMSGANHMNLDRCTKACKARRHCIPAKRAYGGRAFIVYPLRSVLDAAEEKRLGAAAEVEVGEGDLRSATAEFQRLQKQRVFGTDK